MEHESNGCAPPAREAALISAARYRWARTRAKRYYKGTCSEIEGTWATPWDTIDTAPHLGKKRMKSSQMGQKLMCTARLENETEVRPSVANLGTGEKKKLRPDNQKQEDIDGTGEIEH